MAVTSGKSSRVTVLGAGNALGTCISPIFVSPGKRMRSNLLEGTTAGANGNVSKSDRSNGEFLGTICINTFFTTCMFKGVTSHSLFFFSMMSTGPMYH